MNPFDPGYFKDAELGGFGFARLGQNVQIARNCTIIGIERIEIGSDVRIDGPTTIVVGKASHLVLGRFIHISGGCHISAAEDVEMGDFSGLSQGVRIFSATDDYSGESLTNPTVPAQFKRVRAAPVSIGRHVIIGTGSVVLPGANIGEGSAVGALSLVNRPIGAWGIFAGNPVKRIKERSKALLQKEDALFQSMGLPLRR
ncbi:MAG: acyltransferase [Pseudorhodobacter sp.]|nr:acyltransferase [Pseudorhodobacter sp.]